MTGPTVVVGKAYYSLVGEYGQSQGHLGESRVDGSRVSCAGERRGGRRGKRGGTRCSSQEAKTV